MPNYQSSHPYYAGVDLHARSLFVHITDAAGNPRFAQDLLRRRAVFVRQLAQLIAHVQNTNSQYPMRTVTPPGDRARCFA